VQLALSHDFGALNSSESWTVLQAEVDQYFKFNGVPHVRQAVIALNAWTAGTLSWERRPDGSVANRPPAYAGATLGGLWRMRAFPAQRFNDRAAIYYAAELRVIPEWNPFAGWQAFQRYADVKWLQFVPFGEVGRVAPDWDLSTLHSNMKWTSGFGIRAWAGRPSTAMEGDFERSVQQESPVKFPRGGDSVIHYPHLALSGGSTSAPWTSIPNSSSSGAPG
jgi:hypothetical protein